MEDKEVINFCITALEGARILSQNNKAAVGFLDYALSLFGKDCIEKALKEVDTSKNGACRGLKTEFETSIMALYPGKVVGHKLIPTDEGDVWYWKVSTKDGIKYVQTTELNDIYTRRA